MLQLMCRTASSSPDELEVCITLNNDRIDEVHETRTAEHPLPEMTTTGMTLTVSQFCKNVLICCAARANSESNATPQKPLQHTHSPRSLPSNQSNHLAKTRKLNYYTGMHIVQCIHTMKLTRTCAPASQFRRPTRKRHTRTRTLMLFEALVALALNVPGESDDNTSTATIARVTTTPTTAVSMATHGPPHSEHPLFRFVPKLNSQVAHITPADETNNIKASTPYNAARLSHPLCHSHTESRVPCPALP